LRAGSASNQWSAANALAKRDRRHVIGHGSFDFGVTEQNRFRFVAQQVDIPLGAEKLGSEKRDEVTGHMNDVGIYPNACPIVM
jgi:hypothetical protein